MNVNTDRGHRGTARTAGASDRHILTVRGRTTGRLRSTPVDGIDAAGRLWWDSPDDAIKAELARHPVLQLRLAGRP
jgi:hypothetical protein